MSRWMDFIQANNTVKAFSLFKNVGVEPWIAKWPPGAAGAERREWFGRDPFL